MDRIHCFLIITALIVFGCLAVPATGLPPTTNQTCTAMGCGFGLQVEFVGEAPLDYVVTAASSTGEALSVHCQNGVVIYDTQTTTDKSPACNQIGVSFLDFAPQQVMITAQWGGLVVSQDFQPAYQVFYPNGAGCEPECRSARVALDLMKDWQTYSDPVNGFSFKYPANFEIVPGTNDTSFFVGEQIFFYISNRDPLICQGDCSVIETTETVTIAGLEAIKVGGYIGSIGGNVPQKYQAYLFRRNDLYYNFMLYALSNNATTNDPTIIWPMKENDVQLFEWMMETVKFIN